MSLYYFGWRGKVEVGKWKKTCTPTSIHTYNTKFKFKSLFYFAPTKIIKKGKRKKKDDPFFPVWCFFVERVLL